MIKSIKFKNYKSFKQNQVLDDLKPLTILIGKNSSGKSAVLRLMTLLESSLSGETSTPMPLQNKGIELGGEFRDLVYGRSNVGRISFELSDEHATLKISVAVSGILEYNLNNIEKNCTETNFKGFVPITEKPILGLNTEYITSVRSGIQRYFDTPKHYTSVGKYGENVYDILIESGLTREQILLRKVSEFYETNFDGWGLKLNENNAPPYQLELLNDNLKINITEVGLGMIHALPLVTAAYMPFEEEKLIIIEEPEQHLHPAAHGNLAELFAKSLENKKYLIETHSQNFVLRLRRLVAERVISNNDLAIYYVEFDEQTKESNLKKITVDELGKVDWWPQSIFSETLAETSAIRSAQLQYQK